MSSNRREEERKVHRDDAHGTPVIVDTLSLDLLGERIVHGERRWYYRARNYAALLVTVHARPIAIGAVRFAILDKVSLDSRIVCDLFTRAPEEWQDIQLTQLRLKLMNTEPKYQPRPLSEWIASWVQR
jgi:hypothetical protein